MQYLSNSVSKGNRRAPLGNWYFLHILDIISQLFCVIMDRKNRNTYLKHVTQVVRACTLYAARTLC